MATSAKVNPFTGKLDLVGTGAGGGTITGSGSAGQVTYWSGATSITGSSSLTWDQAAKILGLSGALQFTEITTPSNPTTNHSNLFTRANGANVELVWQSATGAECILCTLSDALHVNTLPLNWVEP